MLYMRFCGRVTIAIKLNDRTDSYHCRVAWMVNEGTRWATRESYPVVVRRVASESFDSAESIDSAAHAALSFHPDDRDPSSYADFTDTGWAITRG